MSDLKKEVEDALKEGEIYDEFGARWGTERIKTLRAALAQERSDVQPEPEPVAWMFQHEETGRTMCVDSQQVEWGFEKGNPRLKKIWPLYAHPPQRQPLTEEEIENLGPLSFTWRDMVQFARAIERAHGIGV